MGRRGTFVLAALVLLAVALGAAAIAGVGRESEHGPPGTRGATAPALHRLKPAAASAGGGAEPDQSAERVARAFFASYLSFSYARMSARIAGASRVLRAQIESQHAGVPEAVSTRTPQITQLTVQAARGGTFDALAVVEDGATRYALLATIASQHGVLVVTRFQPWA